MMVTLVCCLYYFWFTAFNDGRETIFISDKAEKAEHNLGRVLDNYMSMPGPIRARMPIEIRKGNSGYPRRILFLPHGPIWGGGPEFKRSVMEAIAQGPDKIQEYHPSAVYIDQIETMPRARETFNAIAPIVKGASKLTISGTASPGLYEELCFDKLELS